MPALLEGRTLRRVFDGGRIEALRGVSIEIAAGEFVAIQGPSGSGKSTLLHLLGALDTPDAGEVLFRGTPLTQLGDLSRFRSKAIGLIFQGSCLLPTLTALENVQIPLVETIRSPGERRRRAEALLNRVGLSDRLDHRPAMLSGGERQRVAIARSLANDPELLLADEPTGNLDSGNAVRVLELLQTLHTAHALTIVMVTHDGPTAAHAGRVVNMCDGRIVSGRPVQSSVA